MWSERQAQMASTSYSNYRKKDHRGKKIESQSEENILKNERQEKDRAEQEWH